MSQTEKEPLAHITHNQPRPTMAFNRAVYGVTETPAAFFGGAGTADARKIGGPK